MLFEHNQTVYKEMETLLNEKGKCILILGTCLGKTSTALEYINKYNLKALVIGPTTIVGDSWMKNENVKDYRTYQYLALNYNLIDYKQFDIVILDEVHHAGAEEWGKGINYIETYFSQIKLLGLTATNIRTDGTDVAESIFKNNKAIGLTVLEGIEQDILNGLTYVNAYYNLEEIKEKREEIDNEILRKDLDIALNNTPELKDIILNNMPAGKRKGIIFVGSRDDLEMGRTLFHNIYPNTIIKILHSCENNNDEVRDWFKNCEEGFIVAQNMISEGAHYKGVNTLVMLRRTGSPVLYYQQLGRVLSLKDQGEDNGIVYDLVNNNKTIALYNLWQQETEFRKEFIRQSKMSDEEKKEFEKKIPKQIISKDYASELSEVLEEIRLSELDKRPWDDEELTKLKEIYEADITDAERVKRFCEIENRSYNAIINKACSIGLTEKKFKWDDQKDAILKEKYKLIGKKVATEIGCSESAAMNRAYALGLKFDNNNLYTPEDDDYIRNNYMKLSIKELAEHLNRTEKSIMARKRKLGCLNKKAYTEEENDIIRQYYPIDMMKCLEELKKINPFRTDSGMRKQAENLGIRNRQ